MCFVKFGCVQLIWYLKINCAQFICMAFAEKTMQGYFPHDSPICKAFFRKNLKRSKLVGLNAAKSVLCGDTNSDSL